MKLPVEDNFNDVIGKAQKGLEITTEDLSERAGVPEECIRKIRRGEFDEGAVSSVGRYLHLNIDALLKIGRGDWYPEQPGPVGGFELIATPFYDWHVNAYLLWDPNTKEAIAFDTGTDPEPMLAKINELGLQLKTLFLTHSHGDHIEGAPKILSETGADAMISELEPSVDFDAAAIDEGFQTNVGCLSVEMFNTTGHTSGGATFVVRGLDRDFAIVGDAIFAGSMGGPNVSYDDSLKGLNRILSLADDTVLASGHGPLTTVGQEKQMNCFYIGS